MHLLNLPELLAAVDVDGVSVIVGPAFENNNLATSHRNDVISLALARFGDEWVVSAFPIGAGGEPNTETEIFVKTFTNETVARWLYMRAKALLTED